MLSLDRSLRLKLNVVKVSSFSGQVGDAQDLKQHMSTPSQDNSS
jgi:hypothetical protein